MYFLSKFIALESFECTFEVDTCNWITDEYSDFNFTRKQASSGTSGTGPFIDHTTLSIDGWYMSVGKQNI